MNLDVRPQVVVAYATSPDSTALQWLDAAQTAGKKRPYLFSQCQVRLPHVVFWTVLLVLLVSGLEHT